RGGGGGSAGVGDASARPADRSTASATSCPSVGAVALPLRPAGLPAASSGLPSTRRTPRSPAPILLGRPPATRPGPSRPHLTRLGSGPPPPERLLVQELREMPS